MAKKVAALRSAPRKLFTAVNIPGAAAVKSPDSTDMSHMDLAGAVFNACVLRNINFTGADLTSAVFIDCVVDYCVFDGAAMQRVSIRNTAPSTLSRSFYECSFDGADMRNALLSEAEFRRASFKRARLKGADFGVENIRERFNEAKFGGATGVPRVAVAACPALPIGAFEGWKRCADGRIVKLLIPADAKRSAGLSNKCRASHVMTLDITSKIGNKCKNARSLLDSGGQDCAYRVGYITEAHAFDDDRWETCAPGIHFFLTRYEAHKFSMR
mgnify:CR=1 FL=1